MHIHPRPSRDGLQPRGQQRARKIEPILWIHTHQVHVYVCVCVCVYVCMRVCICICMIVCLYVYVEMCLYVFFWGAGGLRGKGGSVFCVSGHAREVVACGRVADGDA